MSKINHFIIIIIIIKKEKETDIILNPLHKSPDRLFPKPIFLHSSIKAKSPANQKHVLTIILQM